VQDLVPGYMKFVTRPLYGVILRIVACCLVVVGIVAAAMDAQWAGFSPSVWFLLAIVFFLGVICNLMAQTICRKDGKHHEGDKHHEGEKHHAAAETPKAWMEGEAPAVKAATPAPKAAVPAAAAPALVEVEIYCVKCREKRMVKDPAKVTLANGRPAQQGACPVCGTKVTRLLKVG